MSYVKPYIDETGLHIPTYQEILADMIEEMKNIYGQDIYLENDSADYQMLSIFALKQADTLQAIADAYNSRSPATAVGVGLDSIVKLNGIKRKPASYSQATVTLTGTSGTVINNGVITDEAGYNWDLPSVVTISEDGTASCVATCQEAGAIVAAAGALTNIATPTFGWQSVTNEFKALEGDAKETDAELRIRQALSVALPSVTLLDGTRAAIAALDNVKRYAVYENDTNKTSEEGFPPHSVTCVVEGGEEAEIAEQIVMHKGVGCYTHGDVAVEYKDASGYVNTVRFFRPTYREVFVSLKIKKYTGYVSSIIDSIRAALNSYINEVGMAGDISIAMLAAVVGDCNPQRLKPIFGLTDIQIGFAADELGVADLDFSFNEVPSNEITNISVEVAT